MSDVVGDFLELYKKYYPKQRYPYYLDWARDGVMYETMEMAIMNDAPQAVNTSKVAGNAISFDEGGSNYSTTNLQKI